VAKGGTNTMAFLILASTDEVDIRITDMRIITDSRCLVPIDEGAEGFSSNKKQRQFYLYVS
jgi:hypothetical protein